jgi:hypothetical protein
MKWIVVAIVVFVVGYTYVNLHYRKPGRAFRPYEDMNAQATTARLLAAGWHKLPVDTRRPVERPGSADVPAAITRGEAGLGADLAPRFAAPPDLAATIDRVVSPASVAHGEEYTAYFTASQADLQTQLGELALYHREHELVLVPTVEPLPGHDLRSRRNDSSYCAAFSTASLPPGRYRIRIVARGPAATWSFTVRNGN